VKGQKERRINEKPFVLQYIRLIVIVLNQTYHIVATCQYHESKRVQIFRRGELEYDLTLNYL